MTEFYIKINEWFVFSGDKTLEELNEMEPPQLYVYCYNQMIQNGDFFGNGIELVERTFKDGKEYGNSLEGQYKQY